MRERKQAIKRTSKRHSDMNFTNAFVSPPQSCPCCHTPSLLNLICRVRWRQSKGFVPRSWWIVVAMNASRSATYCAPHTSTRTQTHTHARARAQHQEQGSISDRIWIRHLLLVVNNNETHLGLLSAMAFCTRVGRHRRQRHVALHPVLVHLHKTNANAQTHQDEDE
eukprot:COSAG06_NODE_12601_length_1356_cov_1.709857_2_plen_166_part_00